MAKSEEVVADSDADHVVISGVTVSELQENMKSQKFTESCTTSLSELSTKLLEDADEIVAKNEIQPEIEYILLTRKSAGSPFFSLEVGMASTVKPEDVTTITDRSEKRINANREPKKRTQKLRAVDITSDHDSDT